MQSKIPKTYIKVYQQNICENKCERRVSKITTTVAYTLSLRALMLLYIAQNTKVTK